MKKKGIIITGIAVVLIAIFGVAAKKYYDQRYVGTMYYAYIRSESSIEPEMLYSSSGESFEDGHEYALRAYNEKGEMVVAEFSMQGDAATDLYQDGTYLAIEHSETIVVKQKPVDKSEVPVDALKYIEQDVNENK